MLAIYGLLQLASNIIAWTQPQENQAKLQFIKLATWRVWLIATPILTAVLIVVIVRAAIQTIRKRDSIHQAEIGTLKRQRQTGNEFSDLKVTADLKREVYIEVWYFYNGEFGEDAVHVDLEPLNDGQPLVGHRDNLTMQKPISVVGHKVLLKGVYYIYEPHNFLREPEESTQLQLCMVHRTKGVFHRQTFPIRRHGNSTSVLFGHLPLSFSSLLVAFVYRLLFINLFFWD